MELDHVFQPTRQQAGSPKRQQAAAVHRLRLTNLNEKDKGMRTGESNSRARADSSAPILLPILSWNLCQGLAERNRDTVMIGRRMKAGES